MKPTTFFACAAVILSMGAGSLAAAPARKATGSKPTAAPVSTQFADASATWADIQAQVNDLRLMVEEKRLDEIHPVAFEIRDLVRMLPDQSKALPAAAQAKLEAQVRIVDRLAEQLDRYGDTGNGPGVARQQQALLRALKTIQGLYPAGSLELRDASAPANSKERELYLTPGGAYTEADIKANGNQLPKQKWRGVQVSHDLKPKVGDRVCPITLTKANSGFGWVIGGKEYTFCCPPCLEEYLAMVKKDPSAIKPPDTFVKRAQ